MAVAVNDIARVVINGEIHGQRTVNVLHFKAVQGGPNLLTLLVTAVVQCIIESLLPRLSSEWRFHGVKATQLTGDFDELIDSSQSAQGGVAQDAMPSLIAAVIRFHTAKRGRRGRGRMYIAGAVTTSEDESQWENPDVTFGDFLTCLLTKFVGFQGDVPTDNNWRLVVYSRKDDEDGMSLQDACALVVGGSVNGDVCTMRSRKLGHGT